MDAAEHDASLLGRPAEAVLFRGADPELPVVTATAVRRAARRLAERLPDAPAYLNLGADRCAVAIGLAAALLRGVPCVLAPDLAPATLARLRTQHPGAASIEHGMASPTVADRDGPDPGDTAIPAQQIAAIGTTSGSTGAPVAHAKSWGALVARSRAAGERFGLFDPPGQTIVATVPPSHMYGFETSVLLPLHVPVAVWAGTPVYPADIRAALAAMPPRPWLVTTPVQLAALLASGGALPPLRGIISATAPLDPALAARAEAAWGAPVLEIFGATEVGSIASRRTTAEVDWTLYPGVRAEPTDDGAVIRAPFAVPTALPDRIAMLDSERFRLTGRVADMVKRGGRRASLTALTQALAGLDGVTDAAFFLAGETAEERPQAVAVAPTRTAADLLAELRGRIEGEFLPRRIVLVDRLPRNPLGKLPRAELLALTRDDPVPVGRFALPVEHPCFAGHFPGRPLLPAAALLAEVAAAVAAARPGERVAAVLQAKFLNPVRPGDLVEVTAPAPAGDRLRFTCRVGATLVAQGLLRLDR